MINGFTGKYGFLSNFYIHPIGWRDIVLMSAEHAYQSEKTTDDLERETIYRALHPVEAKRLGGPKKLKHLKPDWDTIKELLLSTGDEELVEKNWWGDVYWGVCDGRGKNKLGKLLMQVREEI